MGRQALSSLWVTLVVTKAGINHDTVQNGLNICKQGEGGDAGTCKLMLAEHSLGGGGCPANGFTILPTSGKCYRMADKTVSMQTIV